VKINKDIMFYKFSAYGFLKNLRFFEPFILLIFLSYGLSYLQIGLLYSIRDIATTLLEIPTGLAADAFGRRRAMVSAFVSYLISFVMIYFVKDFFLLSLAMILFAFGEAFRTGTHKALILEYLKINSISDLKVAYYGMTRSASQLGSAFNALIAAALAFYTGSYRIMFLAALIPYVLDLVNLASYPRVLDGEIPGVQGKEIWSRFKDTFSGFTKIITDGKVFRALLNSASFSAFFKSTKDYLQPILAALALSAVLFEGLPETRREAIVIGLVYFSIYLLTSLASRRAYVFSKRFRNLPSAVDLTYLAGGLLMVLAGLTAFYNFKIIAVVCFVFMFILNNIRRPINVGFISDQISNRVMASGLSAESQLTTIVSALFAPFLGFLADQLGVGLGVGLVGLIMLVMFFFVRVSDRN